MLKSLPAVILAATALSFAAPSFAQTSNQATIIPAAAVVSPIDYSPYDSFIKKLSVNEGGRPRIAYDLIRSEKIDFVDNYVSYLERQNVTGLTKDDQLAYWLNLQNAVTIQAILQDGKRKSSLKKLRGTAEKPGKLWTKQRVNVAGQAMSLQDIETKILAEFDNPNVIYGIYQGVRGAPCLTSKAYRGSDVNKKLEVHAKQYVNSKGIVSVNKDVVEVTPVFLWYQGAAFGGDDMALTDHLKAYARPNLKSALFRGKSFKSKSLNYRLDSYRVPTRVNDSPSSSSSGSFGGSRGGGGGYGS